MLTYPILRALGSKGTLARNYSGSKVLSFYLAQTDSSENIPVEAVPVDSLAEMLIEDSVEAQRIEIEELFEIHQKLELALLKLTNKQRRFVQLRFFENKSYEEICAIEKASMRTVYNVLYEALKRLKGDLIYQSLLIFIFSKYN